MRPDLAAEAELLPLLEDADGIQMAIQQVLESIISNKMDLKRANTILYGLQTAASNIKRTHFDGAGLRREVSTELR
jgi:hypothetical protein